MAWPFKQTYATRWLDNDQYGHLNNSAYYLIADSVINSYLISHCDIVPFRDEPTKEGDVIGLVISSSARYFAPCSFPNALEVSLRVLKLGTSSVRYQVSIHESQADAKPAVITEATHVFVDRKNRIPVKAMPPALRAGLERLLVQDSKL